MIPILLMSILLISSPLQITVKEVGKPAWLFSNTIELGQALEVKFDVKNTGNVAIKFDKVLLEVIDPNGSLRFNKTYSIDEVTLYPGESQEIDIKTGFVVDTTGDWSVIIVILSGNDVLCETNYSFSVIAPSDNPVKVTEDNSTLMYALTFIVMLAIGFLIAKGGKL